ncbi:MAG: hypothetical protein ACM339_07545 [Ignavibacteria bacterium]
MIRKTLTVLLLILSIQFIHSQDDDVILGKSSKNIMASVYDLSNPAGVNIEVNLWGFLRNPGRYIIPYNSTLLDLLSFSGGTMEDSNLKEIRILRPGNDSLKTKSKIIKINYEDYLWDDDIKQVKLVNPVLQSGDVVVVMQEERYSFREDISLIFPIFSGIITLATFIITLSK